MPAWCASSWMTVRRTSSASSAGSAKSDLERDAEERDLVGEGHHVGAPLGGRNAVVEAIEPAVLAGATHGRLVFVRHVLDDDGDILEQAAELRGQVLQRLLHEDLEGHVPWLGQMHPSLRVAAGEVSTASQRHVGSIARARPGRRQRAGTAPGSPDRSGQPGRDRPLCLCHGCAPVSHAATPPGGHQPPDSMVVTLQTGERIHYLDWTAGQPGRPIVLVHELTRTAWSWLPVAHRLAPGHPVIAPDLRGHGASDAPLAGYELESLALDVLTVMAGQGWGESVAGPLGRRRRPWPGGHGGRRDGSPAAWVGGRPGPRRRRLGVHAGGDADAPHAARGGHGRAAGGAGLHGRPGWPTAAPSTPPPGTPTRRPRRGRRSSRRTAGAWRR